MDNRNGDTPAIPEDAARRIHDSADSVVKDVKNAAMSGIADARATAGEAGHTTASKLRGLADQAEADLPWLSMALSKSARGLDTVTDSLTGGDLSSGVSELADFARRQPAIFLGASVALGFALSRVGKTALQGEVSVPRTEPAPLAGGETEGVYPPTVL